MLLYYYGSRMFDFCPISAGKSDLRFKTQVLEHINFDIEY